MSSIKSTSTTASEKTISSSVPASTTTCTSTQCLICLQISQARGGVPLFSPGCCGSWFHQVCIDNLKAQGINNCPNCRAIFTNNTTDKNNNNHNNKNHLYVVIDGHKHFVELVYSIGDKVFPHPHLHYHMIERMRCLPKVM